MIRFLEGALSWHAAAVGSARCWRRAIVVSACVFLPGTPAGAISFEEVSESAGIVYAGMSWGCAWGDFDGDRKPDLWTPNHRNPTALHLNVGDGKFEDVASVVLPPGFDGHDEHGAAWGDIDNDGDLDLIQTDSGGSIDSPNWVFVNVDGLYLENHAAALGLDVPEARPRTPTWLDWNADGLLDLLLTSNTRNDVVEHANIFEQRDGAVFVDVTGGIGLETDNIIEFGFQSDLTGDGRMDLALSASDKVLRVYSVENGELAERTGELELDTHKSAIDVVSADFDNDLLPDIYAVRGEKKSDAILYDGRRIEAHLLVDGNERGLTFRGSGTLSFELHPDWKVDVSEVFIGEAGFNPADTEFELTPATPGVAGLQDHEAGVDTGFYLGYDPASDVWNVLLSCPIRCARNVVVEAALLEQPSPIGFDLDAVPLPDGFLVREDGAFKERAEEAGFDEPSSGRNIGIGDFDNDMDVDIYVVATGPVENLPNVLYENLADGSFERVPDAGGAAGTLLGRGDSVGVADYDGDGYLDLFVTNGMSKAPFDQDGPYQLFRNLGGINHWLMVELEGVVSNRNGYGARLLATTGGVTQLREHQAGSHYRAQNDWRVHFGVADHTVVENLVIDWPGGARQELRDLPADQVVHVLEPVSGSPLGRPAFVHGVTEGVFLWKESFDGPYRLRLSGGSESPAFSVTLLAEAALLETTPVGSELWYHFSATDTAFTIGTTAGGAKAGVDFELSPGTRALLAVNVGGAANPRWVHVGAQGLPLTPAGWICASNELPPTPGFSAGEDLGLFLGLGDDGSTVELRRSSGSTAHRGALTVLSANPIEGVTSLNLGPGDELSTLAHIVELSGIVTSWHGVDVSLPNAGDVGIAFSQDGLFAYPRVNPDSAGLGEPNAYWLPAADPRAEPIVGPSSNPGGPVRR